MISSNLLDNLVNVVSQKPNEKRVTNFVWRKTFSVGDQAKQILVFENVPQNSISIRGLGTALIELADGRLFYFRTSLSVLKNDSLIKLLLDELLGLPEWISDWRSSEERVSYQMETSLKFKDSNPTMIESWGVNEWRLQAVSTLAINQPSMGIQKISNITTLEAAEIADILQEQITIFTNRLYQESIEIANKLSTTWQGTFNYFTPASHQQQLYRRQAFDCYPYVTEHLLFSLKDPNAESIRNAIDNGNPLNQHISGLMNCTKYSIRHLNGRKTEEIGRRWLGRLKELLMILSSLDVNRLPKNEIEWGAFGETIDLLSSMTKLPTTSLSSRLLLDELATMKWNRRIDNFSSYQERALLIDRFAENLRYAIVATGWTLGKEIGSSGGVVQLLSVQAACSLGLSRLEKLARLWRSEEMNLDMSSPSKAKGTFPVLLDNPIEFNGLTIVQLCNSAQLKQEGLVMQNCVGGYDSICLEAKSHIFSVRNAASESCVTIEYALTKTSSGLPQLKLIQQKGIDNSSPGQEFHEPLNILQRFIDSKATRKRMFELLIYQKGMHMGGDAVAKKYLKSMEFINFLNREAPGRIDISRLAAEALEKEAKFDQI